MKEKTMLLDEEMLMLVAGGFDDMDFSPEEVDDDDVKEGEASGGW